MIKIEKFTIILVTCFALQTPLFGSLHRMPVGRSSSCTHVSIHMANNPHAHFKRDISFWHIFFGLKTPKRMEDNRFKDLTKQEEKQLAKYLSITDNNFEIPVDHQTPEMKVMQDIIKNSEKNIAQLIADEKNKRQE